MFILTLVLLSVPIPPNDCAPLNPPLSPHPPPHMNTQTHPEGKIVRLYYFAPSRLNPIRTMVHMFAKLGLLTFLVFL